MASQPAGQQVEWAGEVPDGRLDWQARADMNGEVRSLEIKAKELDATHRKNWTVTVDHETARKMCSMLIMITSSSKRTASQINQSEKKGQPSTFSSGVATHPSIRRRGLQPTRLALFPP